MGKRRKSPPTPNARNSEDRPSRLGFRIHRVLPRLAAVALCLIIAFCLWSLGHHIRTTGRYDYTLEVSSGNRDRESPALKTNGKRKEFHETGAWAMEQGFGFEATSVTLGFWSVLIAWGMAAPLGTLSEWSPIKSVVTAVSLALCSTAVVAFFPPWRLGRSMNCNSFYLVMAAFIYLAMLGDLDKIRSQSAKIFPALFLLTIVLSQIFSDGSVGLVAGVFINGLLAIHIVLLVPQVRRNLSTLGEAETSGSMSEAAPIAPGR